MSGKRAGTGLVIAGAAAVVAVSVARAVERHWRETAQQVVGEAAGDEATPDRDRGEPRVEIDDDVGDLLVAQTGQARRGNMDDGSAPLGIDILNTIRTIRTGA